MQLVAQGEMERREKEIRKSETERERHPISDNVWTSADWKRRHIGIGIGKKEEKKN